MNTNLPAILKSISQLTALSASERDRALTIAERLTSDEERIEFVQKLTEINERLMQTAADACQGLEDMRLLVEEAEHMARKFSRETKEQSSRTRELKQVDRLLSA